MEKEKNLIIGCGGCGNRQLETLLSLDIRYTGIYLNSNLSEMEKLKHYDGDRRAFYIPNADGCGKDMDKMEVFCKEEAPKFTVMMNKFSTYKYITFITSANGGTGAMATIMFSKLLKRKIFPDKPINVVATYPALTETEIDFKNATRFWNEMITLKQKGIINSIQYIDNNKGDEEEVNLKAMKELNDSFDIMNGKLDSTDSAKVHCTTGYKVFLKLKKDETFRESVENSVKESVFYMPDNFECDKIIGDVNTNEFDINDIKKKFDFYDFNKFNFKKDGETKILISGCEMPKETIELIREAEKEIQSKKEKRVIQDDLIIRTKDTNKKEDPKQESKSRLSSKDLDDMFKDDSFWDD